MNLIRFAVVSFVGASIFMAGCGDDKKGPATPKGQEAPAGGNGGGAGTPAGGGNGGVAATNSPVLGTWKAEDLTMVITANSMKLTQGCENGKEISLTVGISIQNNKIITNETKQVKCDDDSGELHTVKGHSASFAVNGNTLVLTDDQSKQTETFFRN